MTESNDIELCIDENYLERQARFSAGAFGPGSRMGGVSDHIRKELDTEVREGQPDEDPQEWIDVIMLALDGAWRSGLTPRQIIDGLHAKLAVNESRTWPDWRTAEPGKAIEHDRSGETPATRRAVLYVSHGIKGKTEDEIASDERRGKAWAEWLGYDALLPRTIEVDQHEGRPCPAGPSAGEDAAHAHACYMRSDLIAMLQNADAILMMPGWEQSVGARAELNTALTCGIPVLFYGWTVN